MAGATYLKTVKFLIVLVLEMQAIPTVCEKQWKYEIFMYYHNAEFFLAERQQHVLGSLYIIELI